MVVNEHHVNLIQRSIDGELSKDEQDTLDRFLAGSAPGRELHTQLVGLSRLRELIPMSDPPPDLKSQILEAVAARHTRAERKSVTGEFSFFASLRSFYSPKLAYGLAAGLLLGIALGVGGRQAVNDAPLNPTDIAATLVVGRPEGSVRIVETDSFERASFSGDLAVQVTDFGVFVQLQLNASELSKVELSYRPEILRFWAFQQTSSGDVDLVNQVGQLAVSHSGNNTYLFAFERTSAAASDITIGVEGRGDQYSRTVRIENNGR